MNTVYIAGKITGEPEYRKKFKQAEAYLAKRGYTPVNPAWLPESGFDYDAYIRMSMAMLRECDAIFLLPDWTQSKGAMGELAHAVIHRQTILWRNEATGKMDCIPADDPEVTRHAEG